MDTFLSPSVRLCLLASIFLLLAAPAGSRAAGQPVTVKDLCLMLRGGYTGDEVLRETAGRPLLEPIDATAEAALRAAGADAKLIAALKPPIPPSPAIRPPPLASTRPKSTNATSSPRKPPAPICSPSTSRLPPVIRPRCGR